MSGGQKGRVGGAVSHGHAIDGRSKEYRTWLSMRRRCRDKPEYRDRGIVVCAEWQSFDAFLAHIGYAPTDAHTIDRWPNTNGNYEPGNVRWATMLEQRHNRRADSKIGRPWLGLKRSPETIAKIQATKARKRAEANGHS